MPLTIRQTETKDIEAAVPLFDAYRRFYGQVSDLERARTFLQERIARNESVLLLAELDGTAVGFTQLFPMFSSVRAGRIWILNDLYVDASARRGGVARALLDAAAAFAREDGALRIVLETGRDNDPANALYRAAGWHADETQWYSLALTD